MQKKCSLAPFAVALLAGACGGHGGSGPAHCPGPVVASWKENGMFLQSSTPLVISIPPVFNLGLVACVSDGNDRTVQFEAIPGYPPMVGVYPLKYQPLHAQPANGFAGAEYIVTHGGNYFTGPTGPASTGAVNITAVDSAAMTFTGTFSFHAVDDSGAQSVDITEGTFTAIKYQ
jgi:hypothetical protein